MFKRKEQNTTTTAPINLTAINEPMSVITEQIKTIRTNINFAASDRKLRTLMVTSAMLGEGRSTVSGNLAVEYAKEGMQVLLAANHSQDIWLEEPKGLEFVARQPVRGC